jgi:hypothetical protein
MRKLLLAMTAVSGLAIAAPAAAQYNQGYQANQYDRNGPRTDAEFNARLDQRIDMIEDRLEAGIDAGQLDRAEVRNLRAQIRTLNRLHREYAANGLTVRERQELQTRLRTLRQEIRMADGGAYDRDRRYGANDDWGDDGVYGNGGVYSGRGGPYDADGDGWDDRDCDRDGDIDSGACNAPRGGLGGFIDTILGNGGLRVGQRVTGDLYAVPSQYRDRYRDDSRFYYRSDGRRIYQIDTRTDVVTRIYATQ